MSYFLMKDCNGIISASKIKNNFQSVPCDEYVVWGWLCAKRKEGTSDIGL